MDDFHIPEELYYHGDEIFDFVYVPIPLALIREAVFEKVSDSAKILYSLLLNRMGLSFKNSWEDKNKRTYIIYTEKEVMDILRIKPTTVRKLFKELSNINATGIGLIKKERVLNKPSRIYVMNFREVQKKLEDLMDSTEETSGRIGQRLDEESETSGQIGQRLDENAPEAAYLQVSRERDSRSVANATHGQSQTRPTVSRERDPRSVVNATHGQSRIRPTVSRECDPRSVANATENNKQDISKQDISDHYLINHTDQEKDEDLMERMDMVRELIKENVRYHELCLDYSETEIDRLDELIEIMVETCVLEGDIELKGRVLPHRVIQSRFEKFDQPTMMYVMTSLGENDTEVKNVKKYLLATLINAPLTRGNQSSLDVQHHLYGRGKE